MAIRRIFPAAIRGDPNVLTPQVLPDLHLCRWNWKDFNLYWENGEITTVVALLRNLLEQDHGNVSIAIFSRYKHEASLDPLLNLADVSVRVSTIEPSLQQYVHSKIMRLVRPALNEAGPQSASDSSSIAAIEEVIVQASDGL